MNNPRTTTAGQCMVELPDIVRVVLSQASRMRRLGAITEQYFNKQVSRLEQEELAPRGLHLVVDELPDGEKMFTIQSTSTGTVSSFLDGRPTASAGRRAPEARSGIRSLRSRR